jgi:hypothetical protein
LPIELDLTKNERAAMLKASVRKCGRGHASYHTLTEQAVERKLHEAIRRAEEKKAHA